MVIITLKVGNGHSYQTQDSVNLCSWKWTILSEPPEFWLEGSSVNQPSIPKPIRPFTLEMSNIDLKMCYDKVIATNNVLNVSLQITHSHTPTHTVNTIAHISRWKCRRCFANGYCWKADLDIFELAKCVRNEFNELMYKLTVINSSFLGRSSL